MQNLTGQVLFSELVHNLVNTFYKAVTFYELKMKLEKEMARFEDKILNYASWEMLAKMCMK